MNTLKALMLTLLLGATSVASAKTIEIDVNGLVCGFCAQGIEKTLKGFPATSHVLVSLEDRIVAIELKDGTDITDAQLRKAITDAGYTVVAVRRSDETLEAVRQRIAHKAKSHD